MFSQSAIAAFFLAFYMHGLTLYFCLSGFAGGHTTVLTAILQIGSLLVSFINICTKRESRGRLLSFNLIDTFYIVFIGLFTYDIISLPDKTIFPENLAVYASAYWFAWAIARSLSFNQLKLFCYTTTCLASCTSLILLIQVMTGTASFVENGGRLVAGASGNPILVGYTGAYAFLTGLILWLRSRHPARILWLGCSAAGFLVNVFSGTRSATLSIIASVALITIYVLNVVSRSNKSLSSLLFNSTLIAAILSLLLVFSSVSSSPGTASQTKGSSIVADAVDRGVSRLDKLFQMASGGGGDLSIQGREQLYENAWGAFLKHPIFGKGLYSVGGAHNAFLQVAAEFGILGVTVFAMPIVLITYQMIKIALMSFAYLRASPALTSSGRFLKGDYWMVLSFAIIIFIQALCTYSFHGDPYRSYLPIVSMGVVLAFLRLNHRALRRSS